MAPAGAPEIRRALSHLDLRLCDFFHRLFDPYEAQARRAPQGVVGRPVGLALHAWRSPLSTWAARLVALGRPAGLLYRVALRERQLERLGRDHARGRYNATPMSHWLEMLEDLCRGARRDIAAALEAARGWEDALSAAGSSAAARSPPSDILTPAEAAPLLGLSPAGLRRRIRSGRAGPWQKVEGRWMIRRADLPAAGAGPVTWGAGAAATPPTPADLRARLERLRQRRA
jgi:hypothetical protein